MPLGSGCTGLAFCSASAACRYSPQLLLPVENTMTIDPLDHACPERTVKATITTATVERARWPRGSPCFAIGFTLFRLHWASWLGSFQDDLGLSATVTDFAPWRRRAFRGMFSGVPNFGRSREHSRTISSRESPHRNQHQKFPTLRLRSAMHSSCETRFPSATNVLHAYDATHWFISRSSLSERTRTTPRYSPISTPNSTAVARHSIGRPRGT
jgi:hypothetical protein